MDPELSAPNLRKVWQYKFLRNGFIHIRFYNEFSLYPPHSQTQPSNHQPNDVMPVPENSNLVKTQRGLEVIIQDAAP